MTDALTYGRRAVVACTLAATLALASAVAGGWCWYMHRREARTWHERDRAFRYACGDNYLRAEPAESRVVIFRRACLRLGVWAGPP